MDGAAEGAAEEAAEGAGALVDGGLSSSEHESESSDCFKRFWSPFNRDMSVKSITGGCADGV